MTKEEQLIKDIKTLIHMEKYIQEHVIIYDAIKDIISVYDNKKENNNDLY